MFTSLSSPHFIFLFSLFLEEDIYQQLIYVWNEEIVKLKMEFSTSKTKVILTKKETVDKRIIFHCGCKLEEISTFDYSGSFITNDERIDGYSQ